MELIFVRHGLPEHIEKTDGSPADPPLAELGRRQAEAAAAWLTQEQIDAIYVSPMFRARETAQPLEWALKMEAIVADGIAEFDRDHSAYIPSEVLKQTNYEAWQTMMQGGYDGLGDPILFQDTVSATVAQIASDHKGQRVVVVCHGGVINAYISEVLGRDRDDFMFCNVDYTSISRVLVASSGQRSLMSLNETAHIRSLPHPRDLG
ncbi:MAG: histidine phosphatase family protein [Actinomycetia bacterium]|nr:histidine phosphatase family protein [Actinomycetes bacterium]MCP4961517.1 histidine phosphatase family protein [Actinomycetes bacterium]